jgi:hypothetical protein
LCTARYRLTFNCSPLPRYKDMTLSSPSINAWRTHSYIIIIIIIIIIISPVDRKEKVSPPEE